MDEPSPKSKYRLPAHPLSDRGNPFEDEQGENPFAESKPEAKPGEPPQADNVYAASEAGERPYYVDNYETTYQGRYVAVPTLGALGLVCLLMSIVSLWLGFDPFSALILVVVTLGFSLPALLLGMADLRGVYAGAVSDKGVGWIWAGTILGGLATAVPLVTIVVVVVRVVIGGVI